MQENRKHLSLRLAALMINDFVSATEQLPEQDPSSIELSATRENVARNFSLRWLSNFEKVAEKNMDNLDGTIVNPQLNEKISDILRGLE